MNISGFHSTSLSDYPRKVSAIIFTQGCNFRCPYCHNPELIPPQISPKLPSQFVLDCLKKRANLLQAVVITGGEPTLQPNLVSFLEQVKALGYKIKLDTNGSCPNVIEELAKLKCLDYIAMDIKAPLEKYHLFSGCSNNKEALIQSINLIRSFSNNRYPIQYEFRTTVTQSLHNISDIIQCGKLLNGASLYILQDVTPQGLGKNFCSKNEKYSNEEKKEILKLVSKFVNVYWRN